MLEPTVFLRAAIALLDGFPVLAGADLTARPGNVVLLTGPNGAGKTSLLRVLAGLQPLSSGEGIVLGHDLLRDRREVRRKVGYVAHLPFLYGELTVEENLRFAVRAVGGDPRRIAETLDRFQLSRRLAGVPVSRLSAGQKRRASLSAIVARDPQVWLLDEPHAGLDPEGRSILAEVLIDAGQRKRTVIFSSHDPESAGRMATAHVHVEGGQTRLLPTDSITAAKVPFHVA